jgi:hypothetical protein
MKKDFILSLLLIVIANCVKAQKIEDSLLRGYIKFVCPTCLDTNSILTQDARKLTNLTLGINYKTSISTTKGLEGFLSLKSLNTGDGRVTFDSLPPNIDTLIASFGYSSSSLLKVPSTLKYLYIRIAGLLPPLPKALKELWLNGSWGSMDKFPDSLVYLTLFTLDSNIKLPKLPDDLKLLKIFGTGNTVLAKLPSKLETLFFGENIYDVGFPSISLLPKLPSTLVSLGFYKCYNLKKLPILPTSLKTLSVVGTTITPISSLPFLPEGLESLKLEQLSNLT